MEYICNKNVQIIDINYNFSSAPLFEKLSLTFVSGLVGLLGNNGAGKSTLLKMLSGILKPSQGKVLILGQDLYANTKSLIPFLGYVPPSAYLYRHLTVQENLQLIGSSRGLSKNGFEQRLPCVLQDCDIENYQRVLFSHCSDGIKKRVMIAAAILHQPTILILDEPCASLDPGQRQHLWSLLKKFRSQGMDILFSSHHPQEITPHCDALYTLSQGKIYKEAII